jgi:glycosyltransferase involved in cell wall biosynthesis
LNNVQFLPFQPREEYPLVLAAADVQLVSLNAAASALSMPSKALKIMAAGRPILAQASAESELARLVQNGKCGIAVAPDNAAALAEAIHRMAQAPALLEEMGKNARRFFERNFDRRRSVDSLESILFRASGQDRPAPGPLRVTENAGQG